MFALALLCVAAIIAHRLQDQDGTTVSSLRPERQSTGTSPAAPSREPLPEAERQKLVGRWQRADANYVLEINRVAPDGQLDAAYLNPRPIRVSKAQATSESGQTRILIELRDRLYPGNYYTLTYDPRDDRLSGVYHHLGIQQEFDVVFIRIGDNR
jgi:hypothetical protein